MVVMHGILNYEELVGPLADRLILKYLKKSVHIEWTITTAYVDSCQRNLEQTKLLNIDFNKVQQSLQQDLKAWKDRVMAEYKAQYRPLINWLAINLHRYNLDRDYLIQLCVTDSRPTFVKNIARQLNKREPYWALRGEDVDTTAPVVVHNILGNENLISNRLTNDLPMWFIDSGYTNFLTGKKTWHRLVKDHLHHNVIGQGFPADRLSMFPKFPEPWRTNGKKILVVESSEQHYKMRDTCLANWRYQLRKQLQNLTDRPIEFKSKTESRKTRISVYQLLKDNPDDYYCVITESSAAAIEAIWLGIPVITLKQHISSPVARTEITDIDNLYRGPIGDWLCALSYCQFTKTEMLNGTAVKFTRKFYHV
jgi:hypothetical protein